MRRLLCFALVLLLVLTAPLALAHSGRTDSDGGHYDRSTGEYHYHHGESAHQHPGGVCPYAAKATTKPTAKPATTTKPKTYSSINAYRSDASVKTANSFSKGVLSMISAFHLPIIIVLSLVAFFFILLARARKSEYKELEVSFEKIKNERSCLQSEIGKLLVAKKELSDLTAKHEHLTRSLVTLQQEYQSLSDKHRKLTDSCVAAHAANRELEKQLDDLGQQYNDLYAIWSESQLNSSAISEAMVYVGPSGVYHTRIHGDWHNYRLVPLSEALALRYRPCSLCVPAERFKS